MPAPSLPAELLKRVRKGMAIPAHPLALTAQRQLDERHMRALSRYYIDAGAGGIAVGVHSTQFEIRDPDVGLLEPVLSLAAETIDDWSRRRHRRILKVAGVCGTTPQACREAALARQLGYDACLLSLAALADAPVDRLVDHGRIVAAEMPVIGFYLQPLVGGRVLPYEFWRRFAAIENVLAIKIAPFNRYQTIDVARAVAESERYADIALYTGNDDNIVPDLLTGYRFHTPSGERTVRIAGGLLGHWSVWTRRAVELLDEVHAVTRGEGAIPSELLTRGIQITDSNAAFFDAANRFAGCIPGIHEVLRRQGLMAGTECLDPSLRLSPGQREEIDRVCAAYPHLNDNDFVAEHLSEWLS